ncbi:MAG: hypothetical protein HQK57_01945 [Deltaproteobacteria bacterium]|nr:hypothetical protein [Deltaproteobacteria bacterium]
MKIRNLLTTFGTWLILGLMLWYIVGDVPGASLVDKLHFLVRDLKFDPWRIIQISFVYGIALAIPYVNGGGIATALMSLTGLVGIVAIYVSTCLFLSLDYFLGRYSPILVGLFQRRVSRILNKRHLIEGEQIPPLFQLMEIYFQRDETGRKIQTFLNRLPFKFNLNEQNIILLLLVLPVNVLLGADGGIAILCGEQSRLSYRTFLKVVSYHLIPFALFSYTIHLYVYSGAKLAAAIFVLGGLALLILYMYFPDKLRLSNSGWMVGLKRAAALSGGLGLGVTSFVLAVDSVQALPPITYMLAACSWVPASIMAFWITRPGSLASSVVGVSHHGYSLAECALPGFMVAVLAGFLGDYPYRAFLDCLGLFLPIMIIFGSSGLFSESTAVYWNGYESENKPSQEEIEDIKFRAWRTFIGLVAFCVLLFQISHKVYDGQVFAVSLLVVAILQLIGRSTPLDERPAGWFGTPALVMSWAHIAAGLLLAVFFWRVNQVITPATHLDASSLLANPWIISGTILAMSATFIFSVRLRPPASQGTALPEWDDQKVTVKENP